MTTRRQLLTVMGGAALLAACRDTGDTDSDPDGDSGRAEAAAAPAPDALVVARTQAGLVTIRGDRRLSHGPAAVGSGDGTRVFTAAPGDAGSTALLTTDLRTGTEVGRASLSGAWVPRVVDPTGRLVALTGPTAPGATSENGVPAGRAGTPILIASPTGEQHRLDLPGNIEPDAISADSGALFVLEWLPADAPDRYRVRMVDLGSGVVQPVLTRDKVPVPAGAEEEMRGQGRQAVLSGDRQVLYTLYTHQADHQHTRDLIAGRPGGVHAFVHVLHLTQCWAYCLDLPDPFGHGPAAGHALAVSPDGRRLLVADITGGKLAEADTESLTVTGVTAIPTGTGTASLAAGADRAFLGIGERVHVVGATPAAWKAIGEVRGLGVDRAASRLAIADPAGVSWVDIRTGAAAGRVPVDGLTTLVGVS